MKDPKQLVILFRITDHLEGITPVNGYDFNLLGRVFRGRTNFGADEPTPFLSILENLRPDQRPQEAGPEKLRRIENWELLIQGWVQEDRSYPTDDLYRLKAAVEIRLSQIAAINDQGSPAYPSIYRLGGLINGLRIGPGVVRAATPQVGGAESFYLPVAFSYATNVSDPYALS